MSRDSLINDVSDTAIWVARYRALESERPDAAFRDPLAGVLAGERGERIVEEMQFKKVMSWVMVVRTTAIDRLVLDAVKLGADTVLNLGAGLDTRPYRLALPAELRWIEVDFPHIVDLKNERLKEETPVCRLERIALDLSKLEERKTLFTKIAETSRCVLVITEGVLPYLPPEEVAELADELAASPRFRFWIQDFYPHGNRNRIPSRWKTRLKAAPFKFNPKDWAGFFAERGWRMRQVLYALDESKRIGRPFPKIFPWSLLMSLLPKSVLDKVLMRFGYGLFERA